MSTLEERVRQALHAYGEAVPDAPELWDDIRAEARPPRRFAPRRVAGLGLVAVAAAAALVVGAVAVTGGDGGERVEVGPAQPEPDPGWRRIAEPPVSLNGTDVAVQAVWTGGELLVVAERFAGPQADLVNHGLAYDPQADEWRRLPEPPLRPRSQFTATWTGREMVVWGGFEKADGGTNTGPRRDGAAYDPATNRWRRIAEAPVKAWGHSAVWTGEEVIVTAGEQHEPTLQSAAYDPETDRWRRLPDAPVVPRFRPGVAWVDDRLVVAGGVGVGGLMSEAGQDTSVGAVYDPRSDRWSPTAPVPELVWGPATPSVLAGDALVVFGVEESQMGRGARYDHADDTWRETAPVPFEVAVFVGGAWDGSDVLLLAEGSNRTMHVVSYDPAADTWSDLDAGQAGGRLGPLGASAGEDFVVLGGEVSAAYRSPQG